MIVYKNLEFVNILKEIEKQPTVYYSVAGGSWCAWNGNSWNMDCVCMVKGVLWGFDFNKSASHGGAIYLSNGVADDNADGIIKRCYDVSRDFRNIQVGELMHMDGHVGVYIGDRKVVEATAWYNKVIISTVEEDGRRTKDGNSGGYWKEHGKLEYIDYSQAPTPTPTPLYKIGDKVKINGVYISSDSTKILTPAITEGTIVRIIDGARNPYLVDNIGWVNDDCIVEKLDNKTYYTVVSGDTLWGIALKFYGDGMRYPEIAKANNIENPDLIYPGQVLYIP